MAQKIGIDLGTANSLVYMPKQGIVLNEPSVVAVDVEDNRVLAVGHEAREMIGRTPEGLRAVKPIRDGVIADYRMTEALIKCLIRQVSPRLRFSGPECLISVPAAITSTEKRAVIEVAENVGVKHAYVAKEPVLAALGAGVSIEVPSGSMVVDIGGGTTEVGVVALGGIVSYTSARVAGDRLTEAIVEYLKKEYGLAVGEQTGETLKQELGSALPVEEETREIHGREAVSGLPKHVVISSEEITLAMQNELKEIVQTIKNVLQDTPPELASDIIEKGITVTGGGAQVRHIDDLIARSTGVPCSVAEEPVFCVSYGTGVMLQGLEKYKRALSQGK